jgi:hypothetical protein
VAEAIEGLAAASHGDGGGEHLGAPQELAGRAAASHGDGGGEHMGAPQELAGRVKAKGWHMVGARGGAAHAEPKEEEGQKSLKANISVCDGPHAGQIGNLVRGTRGEARG